MPAPTPFPRRNPPDLAMIPGLLDEPRTWFIALGAPLGLPEQTAIASYLRGFSLSVAGPVRTVSNWEEAAQLVRSPAGRWWACEEDERHRLEEQAHVDLAGRDWLQLNDVLFAAAVAAAARHAGTGMAMIRTAAGAACYAAYHGMLARAAAVPDDHPFLHKFALFASGRWPLGIYDGRFAIF